MKLRKLLNKINSDATVELIVPYDIYPRNYAVFELKGGKMRLLKHAGWMKKYMTNEDILNMRVDSIDVGRYDILLIYLKE